MHETHISVSKHLRGEKKGGWICPPTWKPNFTRPLMRIDYTSPPKSRQAALRAPEPILKAKMFKKIEFKHFFYLNKSQKNLLK